ncbi:MAG: hypothetical protein MJZ64_02530 [Paludibacteraceae bacterium]|nr:hypothetical protein [Paludibacteraceae bacterium]
MSATISMTYDVSNVNATNMLRMLFASGLFQLKDDKEWSKEEEKEAFLFTSRLNSANILAKHV